MKKAKSKKWVKTLFTILFILLNVVVIAVTAFNEFGNSENAVALSKVKIHWWMLIPAVGCFLIATIIDVYKYVLMLRKAGKVEGDEKKIWAVARRTVLIGKYYDNITPASIGGQPFQIYYMHKNGGVEKGMATTIPIIGMISLQIGFLIIAILTFILGGGAINNPALVTTACFGLLFYAFWPVTIMGATFFPKPMTKIIKFGVRIGARIKLIKNEKKTLEKAEEAVFEYARSFKEILKTRGLFLKTILISVLFHILISSIPFFVLTAFGGNVDFLSSFTITVAVTSAVYFVPTPGNSGAAEGTFYAVFSALSKGYVFWAMLIWRFLIYYIYIILGPVEYLMMHFEKKRAKIEK